MLRRSRVDKEEETDTVVSGASFSSFSSISTRLRFMARCCEIPLLVSKGSYSGKGDSTYLAFVPARSRLGSLFYRAGGGLHERREAVMIW